MAMNQIMVARGAILDELKRRYKSGDRTVKPTQSQSFYDEHTETNYYSGAGEMSCPVCNKGTLRYSRAAYNGHVHAHCTSGNCVSWME
jgi:hypothetical protein